MGSAVDTLTAGSSATSPLAAPKRNAAAHETAVDVTGAKPGLDAGKRELFAESTTSVLVFENGGVIRLAADVAAGQLLFLTHAATGREVVAQVTRKHALGSGYVEVEFTEPAPGFWDVAFPSEPQTAQTRRVESAPAAALREAVERADQEAPAAPNTPDLAEVERLKSEVEALREQLESIKRQPAAPNQPEAFLPAPPWVVKKAKEEALEAAEQAQIIEQSAEAQKSASVASASAAEVAEAQRDFSAHDLLPKAALDFSRADALGSEPQPATASVQNANLQALVPSRSPGKLRLLLFAAMLLAMLGVAWYQGLIPGLSHGKAQPTVAAAPSRPAPAKLAGSAQKPATSFASQAGATGTRSLNSENPSSVPSSSAGDVPPESAKGDSPAESNSEESPVAASPAREISAPLASRSSARSAKASAPEKSAKKKMIDADVAPASEDEEGIVPPRLVHSVRAVPPAEAVRNFATGNVILDAIVDVSGHVQSCRVLSGPASLRSAAVSAVKQYRYAPAKKHGKAVPARVQVTVQFWYEP